MVLQVTKWDIHPDKVDAYREWAPGAIQRLLAVPGVLEFRAYRPASGSFQAVTTYEFADMAAWAAWAAHEDVKKAVDELHTLALNVSREVWGPSPVVPEPIRPAH